MKPHGTSSPSPIKSVGRREKRAITHSHKRLEHLTKVAVNKAYKLHTESRRHVCIVETHKKLGCSNPFFSLSSALIGKSSSPTPSSSKIWALTKDLNGRCCVAARIHTFLNQWRTDSSSEWRTRVASVVPILEEVLYKKAKNQEEYTDPQFLESQLMNVLCHFEAGNGPFLLQGSSPLYPVRACDPPSIFSNRMSSLCEHALGQDVSTHGGTHEIAVEGTHERARFICTQNSASTSNQTSTEDHSEANGNVCDMKVSKHEGRRSSSKIVKKVASMLSKKRKEKSACLKQGLEGADQDAETVERSIIDAKIEAVGRVDIADNAGMTGNPSPTVLHDGNERARTTLGGILKRDTLSMKSSSVINVEGAPLASSSTDEASHDIDCNSEAESLGPKDLLDLQTADAGRLSYSCSSMVEIVRLDEQEGANFKCKAMSQSPFPSSTSAPTSSSFSLLSSSSASPPCRLPSSFSQSPSALAPSPLRLTVSHKEPLPLPIPSAPSPLRLTVPHQEPLPLPVPSSSLPPQEHLIQTLLPCMKPFAQRKSPSFSKQFAPSPSSDVHSAELNHKQLMKFEDGQNGAQSDCNRTDMLLQACQAKEPAPQLEFEQSRTQTAPDDPRKIERGESSSTSSMTTSPSASSDESLKTRERKVKLPLRSFLAEREEYMGCKSSYEKGGPWDTWEEVTEQLDGMCCVCMVGLKGAAFIPCGHTFCRKCSRQLWRGRGTCPLCNKYIREILDIY